jgi:hypothetical protein
MKKNMTIARSLSDRLRWLPVLLLALALAACGDTENEYSSTVCNFVYDNSRHNNAIAASAMTPNSGVFVIATIKTSNGVNYFVFQDNQGHPASPVQFDGIDSKLTYQVGMNGGLIIGYGSSIDGVFYAFDRECPNCFSPNALPLRSHPLTIDELGFAHCSNCGRTYNMNNGGIVSDGDAGTKLTRYRAVTTGPLGVMSVH